MINTEQFFDLLKDMGIHFFTGVPDSLLKDLCACIEENSDAKQNIIAANEGSAIGLATGYHLATNKIPLVYMQNSGLGNSINPLLSLTDEEVYKIPLLLMIGWRGEPGVKDEPQHIKQGKVTLDLLESMRIPYSILDTNSEIAKGQLEDAIKTIEGSGMPYAIVVKKGSFSKFTLKTISGHDFKMSREDAMKIVVDSLNDNDIVVSTTGKLSRELYEYRDQLKHGHEKDFLTVGSMGHSSAIALNVAIQKPERMVYCFDGDGAIIMHAGILTNIGTIAPNNFKHIVFNNGAHESVGAQPTTGFDINIPSMALACNYKKVFSVDSKHELISALKYLDLEDGPVLLEIKVGINSRKDLGRPKTTPLSNKISFMKFVE